MQLDHFLNIKKQKPAASQARRPRVEPRVEPYEGSNSLAKFSVPEPESPPKCELIHDDPLDPFEYLWHEADQPTAVEDDDTDGSCLTFDDDSSVPDDDDVSMSPIVPDHRPTAARRPKASECPVYSGPELWYEDDDFID